MQWLVSQQGDIELVVRHVPQPPGLQVRQSYVFLSCTCTLPYCIHVYSDHSSLTNLPVSLVALNDELYCIGLMVSVINFHVIRGCGGHEFTQFFFCQTKPAELTVNLPLVTVGLLFAGCGHSKERQWETGHQYQRWIQGFKREPSWCWWWGHIHIKSK